jgi:hypothetical protein
MGPLTQHYQRQLSSQQEQLRNDRLRAGLVETPRSYGIFSGQRENMVLSGQSTPKGLQSNLGMNPNVLAGKLKRLALERDLELPKTPPPTASPINTHSPTGTFEFAPSGPGDQFMMTNEQIKRAQKAGPSSFIFGGARSKKNRSKSRTRNKSKNNQNRRNKNLKKRSANKKRGSNKKRSANKKRNTKRRNSNKRNRK